MLLNDLIMISNEWNSCGMKELCPTFVPSHVICLEKQRETEQDRPSMSNITSRSVHLSIVAMEKQ
jgi:hypothetical protein